MVFPQISISPNLFAGAICFVIGRVRMENEKEFYKEQIVKLLEKIDDVDVLKYFYTFIKLKIGAE